MSIFDADDLSEAMDKYASVGWKRALKEEYGPMCSIKEREGFKRGWEAALKHISESAEEIHGYPSEQMGKAVPLDVIEYEIRIIK